MKIYESFNDKENAYIVSEFSGEVGFGKNGKAQLIESIVDKFLMGQILNVIAYLHSCQIFHGDLKVENVML